MSLAGPTLDVDRLDDNAVATTCTAAPNDCSLRGAVINANLNPGATINVPAGTYQLTSTGNGEQFAVTGDLDIRASGTSIVGAGAATTIIQQTTNDRVLDVNPGTLVLGFTFNLSGVTIKDGNLPSGSGGGILSGGNGASTTIANCIFDNNKTTGTLAANGGAITDSTTTGSTTLTITNCTFSNNSTATGSGGAIRFNSPGTLTVTRSLFVNNKALLNSAGAINATFTTAAGIYNISQSAFVGNQAIGGASRGGALLVGNGTANITFSRFAGNTAGAGIGKAVAQAVGATGSLTANNNWWGQNSGPITNDVFSSLVSTWLQLRLSAAPNPILTGGTTTLTADIYGSNSGGTVAAANLAGLPAFPEPAAAVFANPAPTLGTISGATTQFVDGQATATYTAGAVGGTDGVTATADNQTVLDQHQHQRAADDQLPGRHHRQRQSEHLHRIRGLQPDGDRTPCADHHLPDRFDLAGHHLAARLPDRHNTSRLHGLERRQPGRDLHLQRDRQRQSNAAGRRTARCERDDRRGCDHLQRVRE